MTNDPMLKKLTTIYDNNGFRMHSCTCMQCLFHYGLDVRCPARELAKRADLVGGVRVRWRDLVAAHTLVVIG